MSKLQHALRFAGIFSSRILTLTCTAAILSTCGYCAAQSGSPAAAKNTPSVILAYGALPLSFEANQGQADADVRFLSHGTRYSLSLTDSAAVLSLHDAAGKSSLRADSTVRMDLLKANPNPRIAGDTKLPGTANYFSGADPTQWHTSIPAYAKVRYDSVYPGIDLVYYGNQRRLEYDFVVRPKADPASIRLHFTGARDLHLTAAGDLILPTPQGSVTIRKPVLYQQQAGTREPIEGSFALLANETVGFSVGPYDHTRSLVIDPVLVYSTYINGEDASSSYFGDKLFVATDAEGNAYLTGTTYTSLSPFPGGPHDSGPFTGFLYKINPAGTAILSSTYLAGANPFAIALDSTGSIYLAGGAGSALPVTPGAFRTDFHGIEMGFVTKFKPDGSTLDYSTFIGGYRDGLAVSYATIFTGLALDALGNAYVTGTTTSTDFDVTPGALIPSYPALFKETGTGVVAKLNATGTALVYATYLGGTYYDSAAAVAVDAAGDAYVTGTAHSSDFPITQGAFQTTNVPQSFNASKAFVTKFAPSGNSLIYSTFLGGSTSDLSGFETSLGAAISVTNSGEAYVAGSTNTPDFPVTPGAFQTVRLASGFDTTGFVTRFNAAGSAPVYSTFLGGTSLVSISDLAVDATGDAFVTGGTSTKDFPVSKDAFQKTNNAASNTAFLSEFDPTGKNLLYSTYLGGSNQDSGSDLALNPSGTLYLAGATASTDFPTTPGALQGASKPGASFLTKFNFSTGPTPPNPPGTATIVLGNLEQTYNGAPHPVTITTSPANLPVQLFYDHSLDPPTAAGSYFLVATISDPTYKGRTTARLNIQKAPATVILGSLTRKYTGSPIGVTATTSPQGLYVGILYPGLTTRPTNVGSYNVVGTINDINYTGTASSTLTILPSTPQILFGSLTPTYTGAPIAAPVTTVPAGLPVTLTYNGSPLAPTAAGTYTVVATVSTASFIGSVTKTLTIKPAPATITLSSLHQVYNGAPHPVTVTTSPSNLAISLIYDHSTTPPTAAGTYFVVANSADPNYTAHAQQCFIVDKAP